MPLFEMKDLNWTEPGDSNETGRWRQLTEVELDWPNGTLTSETDARCDLPSRCGSTEPILEPGSNFRKFMRYLSQFFACTSIMMILFDNGMAISQPTIVLGTLSEDNSTDYSLPYYDHFKNMSFFRNFNFDVKGQRSTYASIGHIFQPVGSILGGLIIDKIGRKKVMFLVNIPMFIAWQLLFFSQNSVYLYFSNIFFGIGIGLAESPLATYMCEVTETNVRGIILTLAILFNTMSYLVPYVVDIFIESWRWTSLMLGVQPILAALTAIFVPESPSWLVSKGRVEEAGSSLRRLRGWIKEEAIDLELRKLVEYHEREKSMTAVHSETIDSNGLERQSFRDNIHYLISPRIRKPFIIIVGMFIVSHTAGVLIMRPYLEIITRELGVEMDQKKAAMFITLCGGAGNLAGVFLVHYIGKRMMSLSALIGNGLCCLLLALISLKIIPQVYSLYAFFIMAFCTWFGISPIPWILQGELFPYTGRGKASAAAAACNNVIAFVLVKTFTSLKNAIHLQGIFFSFLGCSVLSIIFVYFKLPETEGKTKEEIEDYFKNRDI